MSGKGLALSIEQDDDGYFAHIPAIQGCYAQGDTNEEVFSNIQEVLHLILEEEGSEQRIRDTEPIQDFTI